MWMGRGGDRWGATCRQGVWASLAGRVQVFGYWDNGTEWQDLLRAVPRRESPVHRPRGVAMKPLRNIVAKAGGDHSTIALATGRLSSFIAVHDNSFMCCQVDD
eukprot:8810002-Alexandrium_andersonii.AAC.2